MPRRILRLLLILGAAAMPFGVSIGVPAVQAQTIPPPPVGMTVSVAGTGGLGLASLIVINRADEPLWEADIRCTYDPSWSFYGSWTGDRPSDNPAVLSSQSVPGPDGYSVRPVLGWINMSIPPSGNMGPFNFLFDTNGNPGTVWCSGHFFGRTFTSRVTSNLVSYGP